MTFIDSVILIDRIDGTPSRVINAAKVLRHGPIAASELIRLETLVVPIRRADISSILRFNGALALLTLHSIDTAVLDRAAELRAAIPGLKTPDAIHAATALVHGASEFVTRDTGFRRVPGLNVTVLT